MPKRVPVNSVFVVRDGKQVSPTIGEPFNFTDEELTDIERLMPEAISTDATVDLSASDKPAKKAAATEEEKL